METRAPQNGSRVHTFKSKPSKGVQVFVLALMLGEHKTEIIVKTPDSECEQGFSKSRAARPAGNSDLDLTATGESYALIFTINLCQLVF